MNTEQYENITIKYEDKKVSINVDDNLKTFLAQPEDGSMLLAEHIKQEYLKLFSKELNISNDSIAIEIVAREYSSLITKMAGSILVNLPDQIKGSASNLLDNLEDPGNVIIIGEADVDSNRQIWDALVKAKGVIFMIAGKNA
ncbi:hypothetical protein [Mycoplasma sp. P36-A1]|uniref:hypothetical protein n=1 Tax=Mycoplasma sp. P36-A1 TaxID=3252900 RepID=UPI003C2F9CD5